MSVELRTLNEKGKVAEWANRVAECRNSDLSVKEWCTKKGLCVATYYKWQRRIFELAKAESESRFAEVTPVSSNHIEGSVAVTIHLGNTTAAVHNGADAETVAMVLRILRSC